MTEVREMTFRSPSLENWVMSSSVISSAKYSCAGSDDRLASGNTAKERGGLAEMFPQIQLCRPPTLRATTRAALPTKTPSPTSAILLANRGGGVSVRASVAEGTTRTCGETDA